MILQALNTYYDRKSDDLPPEGWVNKGIDYVVVIDNNGSFVNLECLQTQESKWKSPKPMYLPNIGKQALKHSNSGKDANLLWDNSAFVFGIGKKGKIKLDSFIGTIETSFGTVDDKAISALLKYLKAGQTNREKFDNILKHPEYGEEISAGSPIVTFRIPEDNGKLIFERAGIFIRISEPSSNEGALTRKGVCLVTGEADQDIEMSHTVIKGVWGAQTSGATIVSFNKEAFCSYGKTQGLNSSVSKKAVQKYVKALNHLLQGSQRIQVGDASTVFWSDKQSHLESDFSALFDDPPKDNPDALTDAVKSLYRAVDTGVMPVEDAQTRFFVLGLSPNAARISIRFWHTGTVAEFSQRITQHFRDLEITHAPYERDHLSIWWMLSRIAALEKTENIPPNLAGDWMRSILSGTPYPDSLYQATLRRIHAEREASYPRVAILKACLNRKAKFQPQIEKEITVSLDKENKNPGYRLGRLFAALEKIQEKAHPKINATIRDRYYASASGTPASVMPVLMRLKNHHLAKLEKGSGIYFERLLGEIIGELTEFPAQLNLNDQGRFSIGYYHQRQAFFTKSTTSEI